jgi:isopentenyl-diphosphate delta-isomerase
MSDIELRKKEHIDVCLKHNVSFDSISSGFDNYRFVHNALPELNLDEVNTKTRFLDKELSAPIIISSMTGGSSISKKINENLAKAANKLNIALALGSQRAAIEQPELRNTFDVRKFTKNIPVLANLGAVQLNYDMDIDGCRKAVEMINADALILHLNPLQEALQNSDTNFKGLLPKIKEVVRKLNVPVIVKEVGFGISLNVAKRLEKIGVKTIDVAGSGGTNFAKIESIITNDPKGKSFYDWGIPTSNLIQGISKNTNLNIIAGGGIRNGVDIAKAIALGADLVSIGLPLLKPATKSADEVEKALNQMVGELRIAMFSVGAENLDELKKIKLVKVN